MTKFTLALLAIASSFSAFATHSKPVSIETVLNCTAYLNPHDMSQRVAIEESTYSSGSTELEMVHYNRNLSGEYEIFRHPVTVDSLNFKDTEFATVRGDTLSYDPAKTISDRWGHPGHPGSFFDVESGETYSLKCAKAGEF